MLSGFDEKRLLLTKDVALKPGELLKVPVVWSVGEEESFGRELRADLAGADGAPLDARGEPFTVGCNNYRLGQCGLVQPWTFDKGAPTLPDITPQDRWTQWIPAIRRAGAVVAEYFFWAPDDFGNLTPEEDVWYSGQALYRISQADIHAVIDAAHADGLDAVTYGKNWMAVAGQHGVELVRRHPEWCQWMANGQPKWSFNIDQYRWKVDNRREWVQTKGKGDIGLVAVNCYVPECVQYGCEEIVRSAQKYGWDGVRFDDHFTLESVFDGGVLFDGRIYDNGEDFETLSARNNRWTREITRAYNPHFLLGFNYGGVYAERGIRYPEAYAETAKDGGFVMVEWSSWWPEWLKTWGKVAAVLSRENHQVAALGGVAGIVPMGSKNPNREQVGRWESAINYASQGHYYNVPNAPAVVRNTLFMLRYGGLLYDEKTHFVPDGEKLFRVTPDDRVLWKEFVHERSVDELHREWMVSLVNTDPNGIINEMKLPAPALDKVNVDLNVPAGWRLAKTWLLDPDAQQQCVPLQSTSTERKTSVLLQGLQCWNLLVFELEKQ